jgi:hypothetical protein
LLEAHALATTWPNTIRPRLTGEDLGQEGRAMTASIARSPGAGGRIVVVSALLSSLLGSTGCCITTAPAGEPEVPRLKRPSDEVRVRYCAELEQAERARYAREKRRHTTLLGLGLALGTAAGATAVAASQTKDGDKADTLKSIAYTTGIMGGVSLVVGGIDWAFSSAHEHDKNAAIAARSAVDIVTLSDVEEPADPRKDDAHEQAAKKAFNDCLSVEDVTAPAGDTPSPPPAPAGPTTAPPPPGQGGK